jgi:hypothetical protein
VIPQFDHKSGNLPPGIHEATWEELLTRYETTPRRLQLLSGLREALDALCVAGFPRVYVDGSFVTAKRDPADFDACWEVEGVDGAKLDPVLLDFSNGQAAQKARFGGELFIAQTAADPLGTSFTDLFQRDKLTGEPKGIVAIDLGGLS